MRVIISFDWMLLKISRRIEDEGYTTPVLIALSFTGLHAVNFSKEKI